MSYSDDMPNAATNISSIRPLGDDVRVARAKFIHGLLSDERWSISKAALSLGMNKSVLASRMKGETAFLADELEGIAGLLRMDPVRLYADYLAVPRGFEPGAANQRTSDYKAVVSDLVAFRESKHVATA